MSRKNGKFARVTHTHATMMQVASGGGHLSGGASPQDFDEPTPEKPSVTMVTMPQPTHGGGGIGLSRPTPTAGRRTFVPAQASY